MKIEPIGNRVLVSICKEPVKKGALLLVQESSEFAIAKVEKAFAKDDRYISAGTKVMVKNYSVLSTIDPELFLVNFDDMLAVVLD